jgi:hypothetical protein
MNTATTVDHTSTLLLAAAGLVGVVLAVAGLNGLLDPLLRLLLA